MIKALHEINEKFKTMNECKDYIDIIISDYRNSDYCIYINPKYEEDNKVLTYYLKIIINWEE